MKKRNLKFWILVCGFSVYFLCFDSACYADSIKQPNVSGKFYPADPKELSRTIEGFLLEAGEPDIKADVLVLISPHAGYEFSGRTAACGYKAIEGRHYDTIIILGPSHYINFQGAALWPKGCFRTPLGDVAVDEATAYSLLACSSLFSFYPEAFAREHSIEVQLPFLQTVLDNFKIVPVVFGNIDFSGCENLACAISGVIKDKNCLLIASSDMYHGFNYQEGEKKDEYTLSLIGKLKPRQLYERTQEQKAQLCGWAGVVTSMLIAERLGYQQVKVINYTNSARVMERERIGEYCVGYSSAIIYKQRTDKGAVMLNEKQRKRLLDIARGSIEVYLNTGKKMEISENDPALVEHYGAFVTLHKHGRLRGCIGNLIGNQPLYLTIRDMAVEAAMNDSRFTPLTKEELALGVEIEISVLSPMEKINNPDMIELGTHGVLVRSGYRSGVFLPQVAIETGWTKDEFLSNLCAQKAGLAPLAWREASTDIYIFTAEVFSREKLKR